MSKTCYGIIGIFNDELNNVLNQYKIVLKENNVPRIDLPPHITFALYENIKELELQEYFVEITKNTNKIPININHIGLFGKNVLFLAPKPSVSLMELHRHIHSKFDFKDGEVGHLYSIHSNEFVPHVSLVVGDKDKVLKGVEVISEVFRPSLGYISKLCLCTFYPMKVLTTIELD